MTISCFGFIAFSAWCFVESTNPAVQSVVSLVQPKTTVKIDFNDGKNIALSDQKERIANDFQVAEGLQERVAFWFDIYAKYDDKNYIIHSRNKPWIVYEVVNTDDLFERKRAKWLNRVAADRRAEITKLAWQKKLKLKSADIRIQLGQKNFFAEGLERSAPFIPRMEKVFVEEGLPKELARIPLVESSFNHTAESRVGAKGIWQIMPYIGKKFLIMNEKLDERKSPLKATRVAAHLLEENRMILGNWPLAVTAYNHGTGGMRRAKKTTGSSDLVKIIRHYKSASFQFASANFYSCFLAALHAEKYKELFFSPQNASEPQGLSKLSLKYAKSAQDLSKDFDIDFKEILKHNPDISHRANPKSIHLPKGYTLYVPGTRLSKDRLQAYSIDASFSSIVD